MEGSGKWKTTGIQNRGMKYWAVWNVRIGLFGMQEII
jgi:hypothetical protein